VWLNLSFWYKREERTSLALWVTLSGLAVSVAANLFLVPRWGYYGAAWARFAAEAAMVLVSYLLMRRLYPVPYEVGRMAEYVALALVGFFGGELAMRYVDHPLLDILVAGGVVCLYVAYLLWREKIDGKALLRALVKRKK
jgi:O-antigen/teichoic acid export membrane protein